MAQIETRMETVVLVHGIWMNGWDMSLLRYRLNKAGFNALQFSYSSVSKNLHYNTQRLQKFLSSLHDDTIHIVAHSLGGLLVRQLFHDFPKQKPGRVVTLGTPHRGSYVAGQLNKHMWGRVLLGKSLQQGLLGDAPLWNVDHEIGVIAGDRGIGVGKILTRLPKSSDGTVVLEETPLQGMKDYIVMPVNHIGLLFSNSVAQQIVQFLSTGEFIKDRNTRLYPQQFTND
jgi:pimeloyl-ACP methyl ester carboxylesterase